MDLTKEQHQISCKSYKGATDTLAMIRQAFGEERISHTRAFEWHARFRANQKKGETGEEQSQEHDHHFL
jgi:hypothetical protein